MSLKKLQGALIRTFKDLDNCCTSSVAAWRKSLLNSTKSVKKEDVVDYIRKNIIDLGGLKTKNKDKNDDVYEGIAIAYAFFNNKETIIKNNKYKTKKKKGRK